MNAIKKIAIFSFVLAASIVLCLILLNQAIDYQWFQKLGYEQVFMKNRLLILGSMLFSFVFFFIISYFSLSVSTKDLPQIKFAHGHFQAVARASLSFPKLAGLCAFLLAAIFTWRSYVTLLPLIKTSFFQAPGDISDPIFHLNISFYLFTYPFLQNLVTLGFAYMVVVTLAICFTLYFFYGRNERTTRTLQKVLKRFCQSFFAFTAIHFLLKMFSYFYQQHDLFYGIGWLDTHVKIPICILAAACSIIAIITIQVGVAKRKQRITLLGPISVVAILVIGQGLQWGANSFILASDQVAKESTSIANYIEMTQHAYRIDEVTNVPASQMINNEEAFYAALHPWDDALLLKNMNNALDKTGAVYTDIDQLLIQNAYGELALAQMSHNAASANNKTQAPPSDPTDRNHILLLSDGFNGMPEIHWPFRDGDMLYSENHLPDIILPNPHEYTTGLPLGLGNRLALSLTKQELGFLTKHPTGDVYLSVRNVLLRSKKILPEISYDSDPYLVMVGSDCYWIIDGYTSSNYFPNAEPVRDIRSTFYGQNYVRNSVKVVIDAASGAVDYYICDYEDPIIASYNNLYPSLFKDIAHMPRTLAIQLQYPAQLLDMQSTLLSVFAEDRLLPYDAQTKTVNDKNMIMPLYLQDFSPAENLLLQTSFINQTPYLAYYDQDRQPILAEVVYNTAQPVMTKDLLETKLLSEVHQVQAYLRQTNSISKLYFGELRFIPTTSGIIYYKPIYLLTNAPTADAQFLGLGMMYKDNVLFSGSISDLSKMLFRN